MNTITKQYFLTIAKICPDELIGKQIIYKNEPRIIHDVSIGGQLFLLNIGYSDYQWVLAEDATETESIIIDSMTTMYSNIIKPKIFSVVSLMNSLEDLEKRVGCPGSESSKPLFDSVLALSKEVLDLKLKIDELELKLKETCTAHSE
ncbi:MAG: hypothetical protein PHZ02_01470 [Desulfocapsaceae bacterium]|nr:hypothetical protein [Desulfocapsaceae bacterium]